ncbi:hypothetical protein DPMN_100576 [Dreissena polymorpha]|uniref:Uncharacterized protein n=1 Tax=Dreissena polymorpha TaxID=45954 RepID=A0A9D4LHT1_DREPO|nr:hypothetical protein DPMN_100576 [Dreissena polymorpha]
MRHEDGARLGMAVTPTSTLPARLSRLFRIHHHLEKSRGMQKHSIFQTEESGAHTTNQGFFSFFGTCRKTALSPRIFFPQQVNFPPDFIFFP